MKTILLAISVLALGILTGCNSGSSSAGSTDTPPANKPVDGSPDGSNVLPGERTIEGKWRSQCYETASDNLGVRSLMWSLELKANEIVSSEYIFEDKLCQKLIALDSDSGNISLKPADDGADVVFRSNDYDKAVVASYYKSSDKVFFRIRNVTYYEARRLDKNSDSKTYEFSRTNILPLFANPSAQISSNRDFGFKAGDRATYLATVHLEDKRDQKLNPYRFETESYLIWLEAMMFEGRLDVFQRTAAKIKADFYWSQLASYPEPFIRRAGFHDIKEKCEGGTIQTSKSPWGDVRSCVTDRLPKERSIYSLGPKYAALMYEFEFQNDNLFRQLRRFELVEANW